jgi:hypothetical protein
MRRESPSPLNIWFFGTLLSPISKHPVYAYNSVSKLIPKLLPAIVKQQSVSIQLLCLGDLSATVPSSRARSSGSTSSMSVR